MTSANCFESLRMTEIIEMGLDFFPLSKYKIEVGRVKVEQSKEKWKKKWN